MDTQQNSTNSNSVLDLNNPLVDPRFAALVDFKALNGIISDEEGEMKKHSLQWLADALKVDRGTLYNWMKLDSFWDAVNERRKEISPRNRLSKMHEIWYLSALKPGEKGFRDRQLWLANFDPNFRMPTEKVQHELGNSWAELVKNKPQIIEGETSDAEDRNNLA